MKKTNLDFQNYHNVVAIQAAEDASSDIASESSSRKRRPSEATRLKKSLQVVQDAGLQPVAVRCSEAGFEILFQIESEVGDQDDFEHWFDKTAIELDQ